MTSKRSVRNRRAESGQTLVVAVIVLAILLVLGFVFLGIVNLNIRQTSSSQRRSIATDLSEAGIRYAHNMMLTSEEGADWRPKEAVLAPAGNDFTRHPDALYLRPGSGYGFRNDADPHLDRGGPDGLGPFSYVDFDQGRTLIRVRFAPSDASIFQNSPTGPLREPGKARMYTIIEAIGRPGRVNVNDPTTLPVTGGVQFRNYATSTDFRNALGLMHERDSQIIQSRKLIAFASIGIIESARYISNKHGASKPAELGVPLEMGAMFDTTPVIVPLRLGETFTAAGGGSISGGGGIYSNADLRIYGTVQTILNATYGDAIMVAGKITGADPAATLQILRTIGDDSVTADNDLYSLSPGAGSVNGNPAPWRLNSQDPNFTTARGVFRDAIVDTDPEGWARSAQRKEPPSITAVDATTGLSRYFQATRNSGRLLNSGNSGRFGHGQNVYVDNTADRQIGFDEDAREERGTTESLFYDWLNPNNGQANTGWQGPFYVPVGSCMNLTTDGFTITRDGRAPVRQRTWRDQNGADSGISTIRYRIGDPDGAGPLGLYIINTLTPGANIDALNPNFSAGLPFGGLVYFEGNVRVRGVIPTDVQLSIISMGNIYIEGSITKGVVDPSTGSFLTRASRSALMMMAKDYVVLNTTQFFGPAANSNLSEVQESASPSSNEFSWNPVRLAAAGGAINFRTELLLDPTSGTNPSIWQTYAMNYREFTNPTMNTGPVINTEILLSHAMDNGPGESSIIGMDVNYGLPNPTYNFPLTYYNSVTPWFAAGTTHAPIYGLGLQDWQRYPKFEQVSFPLILPASATVTGGGSLLTANSNEGNYNLLIQDTNDLSIGTRNVAFSSTNDYLLGRAAVVPHDVRIEAAVYAEEGSFFVIPGHWYNPNPNDRRDTYASLGANQAEREQARLQQFGAFPQMPFFGEPLDVKVTIIGAVSENMPPPISQQAEWMRKWGWIPREQGASGRLIPWHHVPQGYDITNADLYVPNLVVAYDPMLATGRVGGFQDTPANPYVRVDSIGRPLPPMPKLPVSPTLAYFGEVKP